MKVPILSVGSTTLRKLLKAILHCIRGRFWIAASQVHGILNMHDQLESVLLHFTWTNSGNEIGLAFRQLGGPMAYIVLTWIKVVCTLCFMVLKLEDQVDHHPLNYRSKSVEKDPWNWLKEIIFASIALLCRLEVSKGKKDGTSVGYHMETGHCDV